MWRGNKAQAMKNYNDDLVMSLAIGVWLFDSSGDHSKNASSLNEAMLGAMSVSVNKSDRLPTAITDNRQHNNPSSMAPITSDGKRAPGSAKWSQKTIIDPEFEWVYK